MRRIPKAWIEPYYVQIEGQEKEPWVGSCSACRCKFYGQHARDMHMQSPKHQAMVRRWIQACRMTHLDVPPVINFKA